MSKPPQSTSRAEGRQETLRAAGAHETIVDTGAISMNVRQRFAEGADKVLQLVGTSTLEDSRHRACRRCGLRGGHGVNRWEPRALANQSCNGVAMKSSVLLL